MKTTRLLFWSAVVYGILLALVRGAFPSESSQTFLLVGLPLVVVAVVIAQDLAKRSTVPTLPTVTQHPLPNPADDRVKFLSGQIRVAAKSSDSYFEGVIRTRLKELLIMKVALETGSEREATTRALSDPKEGPRLLHSQELHAILYGPIPKSGPERITMIQKSIRMIGDWKGWI